MKSSQIIGTGLHPPQHSIAIQKVVLALAEELSGRYGAMNVPLPLFFQWVNEMLIQTGVRELTGEQLENYLVSINKAWLDQPKPFRARGDTLELESIIIEWDDGFDSTSIQQFVQLKCPIVPERHLERIKQLRKIEKERETEELKFLVTSPLRSKSEIYDHISTLIRCCQKRLYIMVAFYDDELDFFTSFLTEVAKLKNLDLKIIIRDPERTKNNDQFISDILTKLPDRESLRIFSRFSIVGMVENPGYLHSKMMVTENAVMVGSANLTKLSLKKNEESAIYSNSTNIIEQATNHFLLVWDRLEPVRRKGNDWLAEINP